MSRQTTIIAEIGENHHGAWDIAAKMLELAAQSGADIAKFQSYTGDQFPADDPEREWFDRVAVPDAKHFEFKKMAEDLGIEFMSAPFSAERAKFLCEEVGCKSIKIASGVMTNCAILDTVNANAGTTKKVYLSTGMATIQEIQQSLARLDKIGDIAILHCTTQYPAKPDQANLKCIGTLAEAFPGHVIGYSDHQIGLSACLAAVALGGRVLEKHFTMSRDMPGTDHICAMTPRELAQLCEQVEEIEQMIGCGAKQPIPEELEIRDFVRARFAE